MPDDIPTRLRTLGAEVERQNSELGQAYRALAELGAVTLCVNEADLQAIAEATSVPLSSSAPSPWHGARC